MGGRQPGNTSHSCHPNPEGPGWGVLYCFRSVCGCCVVGWRLFSRSLAAYKFAKDCKRDHIAYILDDDQKEQIH